MLFAVKSAKECIETQKTSVAIFSKRLRRKRIVIKGLLWFIEIKPKQRLRVLDARFSASFVAREACYGRVYA